MTNPNHTDTSRSGDLVKRLRGDWPEILVEKHWMMDSDAIDKQREEAADRIEALEAEVGREPGPCNCDESEDADLVAKLRDEDSYYRVQEKHWCIDAEELDRQRLAAADRIEALKAKVEGLRDACGAQGLATKHTPGELTEHLRAALAARGLEIRKIG